jgi:HAD superfamily hydrolase (TIGR01509 family)
MTGISLILFDLNGVLYRYDRDVRIAHLALVSGRTADAVKAAIWDSGFEDSGDAGALDAEAYLQGFGARIGYDLPESDWVEAQRAAVQPIGETIRLLPAIRATVGCAVLTNNNLLVARHFEALYPEVAALVEDRAFVSAEFGLRKPEPEVFRRCLVRLGVAPEAALFVDDSEANVAGACAAGLHGHIYLSPGQFAAELRAHGLLTDRASGDGL